MADSSILVFNLVFAGTLGIGFLMFLGQLAASMVLLAIAAGAELPVVCLGTLIPPCTDVGTSSPATPGPSFLAGVASR